MAIELKMKNMSHWLFKKDHAIWVISLIVLGIKVAFVFTHKIESLARTPYLIDDSFIAMQIAHNVAHGLGFSFDGVLSTSGTPPLWIFLTVPIHLFANKECAAQIIILMSSLFAALSDFLAFKISRKIFPPLIAYATFLILSFSVPLFFQSLNGMGTFLFTFVGLLILHLKMSDDNLNTPFLNGFLLGLLVWARAEGIFLSILVLGWDLILSLEHKRSLKDVLTAGTIFGSMVSLFLLWNYHLTGQWRPANQIGRYLIAHGYWADWGMIAYLRRSVNNLSTFMSLYRITLGSFVVLIAAVIPFFYWKRSLQERWLPFFLYVLLLVFLYSFYQWYFPDVHGLRYVVYPAFIIMIMAGGVLDGFLRWCKIKSYEEILVTLGLVLLVVYLSGLNYHKMVEGLSWTEWEWLLGVPDAEMAEAWCEERWIQEELPSGAIVATKDIGRLAYFTDKQIVDLAGIVDTQVVAFIRSRKLWVYLDMKNVDYLILYKNPYYYLNRALGVPEIGLQRVTGFCPDSYHLLYNLDGAFDDGR